MKRDINSELTPIDMNCHVDFTPIMKLAQILLKTINRVEVEYDRVRTPEWVPLKKCAEMKGVQAKTLASNPKYQPCGGLHYQWVNGVKSWKYEQVKEWLSITDAQIPDYLNRWGVSYSSDDARRWKMHYRDWSSIPAKQ